MVWFEFGSIYSLTENAPVVKFFGKRYCSILLISEMLSLYMVLPSSFHSLNLQSTAIKYCRSSRNITLKRKHFLKNYNISALAF